MNSLSTAGHPENSGLSSIQLIQIVNRVDSMASEKGYVLHEVRKTSSSLFQEVRTKALLFSVSNLLEIPCVMRV